MARVSEETIQRIRNTADIYDIVAQYVDLKKRGRNYFGSVSYTHLTLPTNREV